MKGELEELIEDPILFAELLLDFNPFNYQRNLLIDKSKRIVACMGRQSGKTTTIATKAIHYAYTHPEATILIVSPSLRQSMIMFDRIISLTYRNQILTKSITRKTRTIIQLTNKSQLIALPCSENLLRGYTANLVILDEAAFMPEEIITEIIFPMLSTTNGAAIFLSTPWGRDHFFYRAFTNPEYSVHKIKSSECPLIPPQFLEEMRQNMTEEAYRREYEAEFTEAATCYFPQDLIRRCVELAQRLNLEFIQNLETPTQNGEYHAGVDLGKLEDHSVIAVIKREEETLKLLWIHEFQIGTSYNHIIGTVKRADQRFQLQKILIDQTGVGEPILEEIRNQDIKNAEGINFTTKTKEELLSNLKITIEQNRLAIPYNRRLCEQINQQEYEYTKSGHLQFSHPKGSNDDMLWALALAAHSATIRRETPSKLIRA